VFFSKSFTDPCKNLFLQPGELSLNFFICLTKYKDMAKEYLGEFEELILTLVAALQADAYGAAIAEEIETKLKREVNLSAVHVTLYRLEDKGYIKSALGGGTKERGGRRKRIFTITSAGMAMLRAMKEARLDLWKLVPQLKIVGGN
jgi:PadR family transcriptional regulator, regulatory protein PadR